MLSSGTRLLLMLLPVNALVAAGGVLAWHQSVSAARLRNIDQMLRDKVVIFVRSIPSDRPEYWPDVDVELETRTWPLIRQVFLPSATLDSCDFQVPQVYQE